jgi:protein-S-isoprenylcysteine O-methyltransferase Ste14
MILYYYFVSLFSISEIALLILKRSKKGTVKSQNDGRSMLILWITIFCCLNIGLFIANVDVLIPFNSLLLTYPGILITVAGFIIRWTAIVQLGKMFTVDVSISSTHTLKTDGIFNRVRHPSYLGLLLIIAGLALLLNNGISFLIIAVPSFYAINYRIYIEERALTGEFGNQYLHYKMRVRKIIPYLY